MSNTLLALVMTKFGAINVPEPLISLFSEFLNLMTPIDEMGNSTLF